MIIRIGDTIEDERGRQGELVNIGISTLTPGTVGQRKKEIHINCEFIGGEVNIAARLETAGDAGKILVSNETYTHVKDIVDVKELNSIKLKLKYLWLYLS